MSVSVLDSRIFKNTFGTEAARAIFSDEAYVKNLIEVEAAIARAEAKVGVIPQAAAAVISGSIAQAQIEYVQVLIMYETDSSAMNDWQGRQILLDILYFL